MMLKKLILILTTLLFFIGFAFGIDGDLPPMEDIENSVSVMVDCISASFLSEYSSSDLSLPSTSVSMDDETSLPSRISFFLADPADYVDKMGEHVSNNGSVLGSIRALFNRTADNPYLSAAYLSMASKGYENGDYMLSGSIVFSYPQGSTVDSIENLWLLRDASIEHLMFNVHMAFYGAKLSQSVILNGWLELYADADGFVRVVSFGPFTVNGIETDKIEFRL